MTIHIAGPTPVDPAEQACSRCGVRLVDLMPAIASDAFRRMRRERPIAEGDKFAIAETLSDPSPSVECTTRGLLP